jgi:hypothetical protein
MCIYGIELLPDNIAECRDRTRCKADVRRRRLYES